MMLLWATCVAIFIAVRASMSEGSDEEAAAMAYLRRYGYSGRTPVLSEPTFGQLMQDARTGAIMDFQSFAGLQVTGELDSDTLRMMGKPRCGVKDMDEDSTRKRRFTLYGQDAKWPARTVTYRISQYSEKMAPAVLEDQIKKAFQVWSRHADLAFALVRSGSADIDIRFVSGSHGDSYALDGPGGELAHAFRPPSGDTHFDEAEPWTADSWDGTNVLQVAVHELGHALGLGHSSAPSAVMAPFYQQYNPGLDLTADDVQGITALYGPSVSTAADQGLCADPSVDTLFRGPGGHSYVFKGDLYYRLRSSGLEGGYPKSISSSWVGLPGHVGAAFTYKRTTFFFKGSQYWRYKGFSMDGDYPKLIADDFPGLPDGLDAVFMWKVTGGVYFFKGSEFWRCDMAPSIRCWSSPKNISVWRGVPDHIDAATVYKGSTFFFKGAQYLRFNDQSDEVDRGAQPPYPRPTAPWWFGCQQRARLQRWDATGPASSTDASSAAGYVLLATSLVLCKSVQ